MNDQAAPPSNPDPTPTPSPPKGRWKRIVALVALTGAATWGALEIRDRAHPALGSIRGLRSGAAATRRAAARGLLGLDFEDSRLAIPALDAALNDPDEAADLAILDALGEAGIAVAQDPASLTEARVASWAITRTLADAREPVRAEAARILKQFAGLPVRDAGPAYNPVTVADALAPVALGDPGPTARFEAAQALMAVAARSPAAAPGSLTSYLVVPDRPGDARGVAAALLGAFPEGRPRALPTLIRALGDADPKVRRGAAVGLAQYDAGAAAPALPALIGVLAEPIGDPATYKSPGLAITAASPNLDRYPAGVVNLAASSLPAGEPTVTWDPAVIAAQAVGRAGVGPGRGRTRPVDDRAIAALGAMLASPHRWRREAAANALNDIGSPATAAAPALIAALRAAIADPAPEPASKLVPYLTQALGKTAPRTEHAADAVAALAQAIPSPIPGAAKWAAGALGDFGAAAAGTLPALREAARSPDAFIAASSAESIRAIENPDQPRRRAPAEGPPGG